MISIYSLFLTQCSVQNYIEQDGLLELFHHFPKRRDGAPKVFVNVTAILDTLKKEDIQTGAWINVVGYIAPPSLLLAKSGNYNIEIPTIQALMIWTADSINLGEYEKVLVERQKAATL